MTGRKTIRIRRSEGKIESFQVETGKYATLLDALETVRSTQAHDLMYRHSCHHGSCGTCGMIVNGERVLACLTPLDEVEDEALVEPLAPFPVIGDLAIDPAPLYEEFPADATYLRKSEVNPDAEIPEEIDGFRRFENCIECGLCVSVCPVQRPFIGPAALAAYNRELEKHPDRESELLPLIDRPDGVWGCDRALRCSQVCPLGVYPAKHIAILQRRIDGSKTGP